MIELNLWFSTTTGNIYGNLTNKKTHAVSNIAKLLQIKKFAALSLRLGLFNQQLHDDFLNHPSTNHNALYSWTKDNQSMVWWEPNTEVASTLYGGQLRELGLVKSRYAVKGAPDLSFRG